MSTNSSSIGEVDSAVRVVVTPSQSSYFAGEKFSVTITFKNTHSPETPTRSLSQSHKRGSHSISSAPLARPPTSPGTPRTTIVPLPSRVNTGNKLARKNLIGKSRLPKGVDVLPDLMEQRRQRLLGKSLSVVVSPQELLGMREAKSASYAQRAFNDANPDSPISPPTYSPSQLRSPSSVRSASLPLSPNHPHARKQSLLDGELAQDMPYSTASASTSTFSLSLDPISESSIAPSPFHSSTSLPLHSPDTPSGATFPPTNGHAYPPRSSSARAHKPSQLGLGHPPGATTLQVPRSAHSGSLPKSHTELILYSYAQLRGTLSLSPSPSAPATPEHALALRTLRGSLLRRTVVGGGSMDISSSLQQQPPRRPSHGRVASFSSGLMSLLSPTTEPPTPTPWTPSHRPRNASVFSSSGTSTPTFPGSFPNGGGTPPSGVGLGIIDDDIDPDAPLPTFEVQPAMLAVDLMLQPGESRSCASTTVMNEPKLNSFH
jgi:hypothetical protein